LRIKSPGVTVRPLVDKELRVELYLVSRSENRSKLASEFVRAFMKRIEQVLAPPQMTLPLSDSPSSPHETMAAKHKPRSERGARANNDVRQVRSRKAKSRWMPAALLDNSYMSAHDKIEPLMAAFSMLR
jgi:hypothetical protein